MDTAIRHRVNAGRVAMQNQIAFFDKQFAKVVSEWKADDTRVTFADFAISENIFKELSSQFSDDQFCSEESNPLDDVLPLKNRYTWILDPIDGTNNYALGIPFCAISLALLKNGLPVYGFVFDYSRNEIIEGGKGFGIRVGKKKLKLPPLASFTSQKSAIGFHFPLPESFNEKMLPIINTYRMRSMGSAALNFLMVARGVLDGAIDFKVKVWDIAAVYAILQGGDKQMKFIGEDPFPLDQFHVDCPHLKCFSGTPSFMEHIEPLF